MKKTIFFIVVALAGAVCIAGASWLLSGRGEADIGASDIVVERPGPNELVSNPLIVEGRARGSWYFEAVFPIKLLDENGNELARTAARAQGDWMTGDFVPFKAAMEFAVPSATSGFLVLMNDNPSGLPEKSKEVRIPVLLPETETAILKLFFNNSQMDPEFSCNKVFPVERVVPRTQAPARKALELLLEGGLTAEEKTAGFLTSINPDVKIQSLVIENGTARVDFDEQLEFQMGGSCRVSAIRAQITQTLKQFPIVKDVVISINGRTEDILQP